MNPDSAPGAPLTLDELHRLAAFLVKRGHRRAAVDVLTRAVGASLLRAAHPGARPTGTGWPA